METEVKMFNIEIPRMKEEKSRWILFQWKINIKLFADVPRNVRMKRKIEHRKPIWIQNEWESGKISKTDQQQQRWIATLNEMVFFKSKNTNFMKECKLNSFVIISIVTQSLTMMHKQTDIVVAVAIEILISCSIPVHHHKFQISMLNFRLMRIQRWMFERKSIINAIASFSPTKRIQWAGEQSACVQQHKLTGCVWLGWN